MQLLWEEHCGRILTEWIEAHPGTRPAMWWRYDAPRASLKAQGHFAGSNMGARMIKPRRLLSGGGAPLHEVLGYAPQHNYGIPAWHLDPDDPPVFETQRAT